MSDKKKRAAVFAVSMLVAGALALIDQLIKLKASQLKGQGDLILIKDVLALTYAENTGAAFSMLSDSTAFLSALTILMIIGAAAFIFFCNAPVAQTACVAAIIGGGVGNLIDRLRLGYVIDYINPLFVDFAIFNFADILITCGCAVLCALLVYESVKEAKAKRKDEKSGENADG